MTTLMQFVRAAGVLCVFSFASPAHSNSAGFIFSNGTYTPIVVPGATTTEAFGINNAREAVGYYSLNGGASYSGFIYGTAGFTSLNVPSFSSTMAMDINNTGQVI